MGDKDQQKTVALMPSECGSAYLGDFILKYTYCSPTLKQFVGFSSSKGKVFKGPVL